MTIKDFASGVVALIVWCGSILYLFKVLADLL
jgi:hypothetical protein